MTVRGPDHAFHHPDGADEIAQSEPWAPQGKRRGLVVAAVVVLALLTAVLATALTQGWRAIAGGEVGAELGALGLVTLVFAGLALLVDRLLFKATRPAFALPGEIYDERQSRLNDEARRKARWISFAVIAGLTALGVLGAPAGVVLAAGLAGFAVVLSGQQLVLAWTLEPDDFAFDADS